MWRSLEKAAAAFLAAIVSILLAVLDARVADVSQRVGAVVSQLSASSSSSRLLEHCPSIPPEP